MFTKITDEAILNELRPAGNLREANLRGADLTESIFTVDLEGIHLEGAHLEGANLEDISFYNAYFEGAHLEGANLKRANMQLAKIYDADFSGAHLEGSQFTGIYNFTGAKFIRAHCSKIDFSNSTLRYGDFKDADFSNTKFEGIDFRGANLQRAKFINVELFECDFSEAHIEGAQFINVDLIDCDLTGAFLQGTIFTNIAESGSRFDIYNLSETQRRNLGFRAFSLIEKINQENPDIPSIIKIIQGNDWDPEEEDNSGFNALIVAIRNDMTDVALELIKSEKISLNYLTPRRSTALIYACMNKELKEVALSLIASGNSNPSVADITGTTALMYACLNEELEEVALALINTDESNPGQISNYGMTALMFACEKKIENVALKLIETGESKPDTIGRDNTTALIIACQNGLEEVALALIADGVDIYLFDNNGNSAFGYATKNNLLKVLAAFPVNTIDINEKGYDSIENLNKVIQDHLKENNDGIVLMVNNQYFLTTKKGILIQFNDTNNLKYACIRAGNTSQFILEENIIYDTEYLSLATILPMQILIKIEDAQKMIEPLSGNMFILRKYKTITSLISQNFLDGGAGASADHCQPGKQTDVYNVFLATPICGTKTEAEEDVKVAEVQPSEAVEESKDEFSGMSNKLSILYNGVKYPISIDDNTSVNDLKELFLDDLISKQLIENKNYNTRFLFKGRILQGDLPAEIKENPSNFVINVMLNKLSGGRKTKRLINRKNIKTKKGKKRKTIKKGKNKKTMKKRKTIKKRK